MARRKNDNPSPSEQAASPPGDGGGKQPVHVIKLRAIRVAIWENSNLQGQRWFSAKLSRRYKDEASGEWRSTDSLSDTDTLLAAEALRLAGVWMCEQLQAKRQEEDIPI